MTPKRRLSEPEEEEKLKKLRVDDNEQDEPSEIIDNAEADTVLTESKTTTDDVVEPVSSEAAKNDTEQEIEESQDANEESKEDYKEEEAEVAATEAEETTDKTGELPASEVTSSSDTVKETEKPQESTEAPKPAEPSNGAAKPAIFGSFGSKFSFGGSKPFGGFSSATSNPWAEPKQSDTKSNPWSEPASDAKTEDKETEQPEATPITENDSTKPDLYAQVTLEKQVVKTGEEEEEELFSSRARLYALDLADASGGWKERGTGMFRINKIADSKYRIVMRADGLLRVILNLPLVMNMSFDKGFASSAVSHKFVRITGVEDNTPHQFAFKLPSKEQAAEFYQLLEDIVPVEST